MTVFVQNSTYWAYYKMQHTSSHGKKETFKMCTQNWFQFLFVVKATALKQQMSENNYLKILSTEASHHIRTRLWHVLASLNEKSNCCDCTLDD